MHFCEAFYREVNNKSQCWLMICVDKISCNEPHNASCSVPHLKKASTSVSHTNCVTRPGFCLQLWNNGARQRWWTCTHAQPATTRWLNIHHSPLCWVAEEGKNARTRPDQVAGPFRAAGAGSTRRTSVKLVSRLYVSAMMWEQLVYLHRSILIKHGW